MKLKQSFRYQLADYKAGILVYYCAMLGLLALFLVSTVVDTGVTVVFSGLSGFSCIFLFICGLCSLHDNLPMHLQNGVSRKTMYTAWLAVTGIVSAVMAAADTVLATLIDLLPLWLVSIPLAALMGLGLQWGIFWVYMALVAEQIAKFIGGVWRLRSRQWINDLTRAGTMEVPK